jgi:hypothetical protein
VGGVDDSGAGYDEGGVGNDEDGACDDVDGDGAQVERRDEAQPCVCHGAVCPGQVRPCTGYQQGGRAGQGQVRVARWQ